MSIYGIPIGYFAVLVAGGLATLLTWAIAYDKVPTWTPNKETESIREEEEQ